MIRIDDIRNNKTGVAAALERRGVVDAIGTIESIIKVDNSRRSAITKYDGYRAEAKALSGRIGAALKAKENVDELKDQVHTINERAKKEEENVNSCEVTIRTLLCRLPNTPHPTVPDGKSSADNLVVKEHGRCIATPLAHWDVAKKFNIIDFELGNKVSAAGFPFYIGNGARLQRALINWFLDAAGDAGYVEVQPPVLVNGDSCFATGQLPDKSGQMYHDAKDDLYLIPTAEVPVTNMYRGRTFTITELPVRHVAYTPCFRREAGSWGADVRGLNRLHQFDKVELVEFRRPDVSYGALERMVDHVEDLLKALGLTYRILKLCAGDLGFTSAMTYDLEVWSPGQQRWLEVSSVSNFETYQANRLQAKFVNEDGKKELLHTLNGSALALPRVMAALLETYADTDHIDVPDVLLPYLGITAILAPKPKN